MVSEMRIEVTSKDAMQGSLDEKPAATRGAAKYDQGKPRIGSLFLAYFPRAIREVTAVSEFGAQKYGAEPEDKGFLEVENAHRRYTDGLVRHLMAELQGDTYNREDGLVRHDAQVAWNALARLEIALIAEEEERLDIF